MSRRAVAELAFLMVCVLSLPVYAGCELPPAPSKIPDAATATESEMLTAMQTLKHYNTDVNNYIKCLQFEANQGRLSGNEQGRLQNAAVDTLRAIADRFNAQVRRFKAKGD